MSNKTEHQMKRFVAPSMSRALELVRLEMGPEAVILSSERTKRGIEIITSLEPDLPTRGIEDRRRFGQNFDVESDTALRSDSAWRAQAGVERAAADYGGNVEINEHSRIQKSQPSKRLAEDIEKARERMFEAKRQAKDNEITPQEKECAPLELQCSDKQVQAKVPSQPALNTPPTGHPPTQKAFSEEVYSDAKKLSVLESELADMRMLLEQQLWQMSNQSLETSKPQPVVSPQASMVREHLSRLGLIDEVTKGLLDKVSCQGRVSEMWRHSLATLSKALPVLEHDLVMNGGVFAFVGQTGVGKTTTIAKLAARYVLAHGAGKVALVTTDNYRVGAQSQLRSLGRILNVPVRTVDTDHSLPTVLASLKQFPLILVDTAGFRHGDPLLKEQLALLDTYSMMQRVLVISCNSQLQMLKASAHAYGTKSHLDACILTKLDESASLGEVMSVAIQQNLPVAYTTDGQEIPQDIERASGHSIVAKAVNMLKPDANYPSAVGL